MDLTPQAMASPTRLAIVLVALLAVACGGTEEPTTGGPAEQVPGGDLTPGADDSATLTGTLGGDATLEGGCAWLDAGGDRYEILWPAGYEVAFEPLRLLGPDGETVAGEAEEVTVAGAPAEGMASICQVGSLFRADEVRAGDQLRSSG